MNDNTRSQHLRRIYAQRLDELQTLKAQQLLLRSDDHPHKIAMELACIAEHKKMLKRPDGKRHYNFDLARKKLKSTGTDLFERTCRPFHEACAQEMLHLAAQVANLEDELDRLAAVTPIVASAKTEDWLPWLTVRAQNYATQGFAASIYTAVRAELWQRKAEGYDVAAQVLPRDQRITTGLIDRLVTVRVASHVDLDLLTRTPDLSLREQVRVCLRREVDPRVFFPTLPQGYKTYVGLERDGTATPPKA